MALTNYNAKQESIVVRTKSNGAIKQEVYITGLAEEFWAFEKQEALAEDEVGATGDVCRNEVNNPLYDITITVQKTSPQANFLRNLKNETEPFEIWRTSPSLGITEGGTQCMSAEVAASEGGATAGESEFKFTCYDGETIAD